MSTQYIVAVFLDGTLVVNATGPFRSHQKAEAICDQLNKAGAWSDNGSETATLIAQVVQLRPASDLLEDISDPYDTGDQWLS